MKFKVGDRIIYKGKNCVWNSFVPPYSAGTITHVNGHAVSCNNWTPHHPDHLSNCNFWVPIKCVELEQEYLNETKIKKLLGVEEK